MLFRMLLLTLCAVPLAAQRDVRPALQSRNLGGPRLGVTILRTAEWRGVTDPAPRLRMISQFGWHFEQQVIPEGGGPQFVVQWVPMVGGVEIGTLVPSFTLALGVRFPNGIEAGMGPNIVYANAWVTSLIVGVGKSFDFGGVSIPINVAYAINAERANRLSFLMGYALRRD